MFKYLEYIHAFIDIKISSIQSRQWKKRYVRALITMSSPWGGAVKSMKVFTSGINFGIKLINPVRKTKLSYLV